MKYPKLLLISTIFVYILVLYFINDLNKDLVGIIFDSFGISCFTAIYFLFLLLAWKRTLPDKFHKIHEFERSGKLYKLFGVRIFKIVLAKNPLPTFTGNLTLKSYSVDGLNKLEEQMRYAESIHFLAFLASIIIMIPFGLYRDYRFFYYINIFNIIVNLYPTLVQRYNRNRINKILSLHN